MTRAPWDQFEPPKPVPPPRELPFAIAREHGVFVALTATKSGYLSREDALKLLADLRAVLE